MSLTVIGDIFDSSRPEYNEMFSKTLREMLKGKSNMIETSKQLISQLGGEMSDWQPNYSREFDKHRDDILRSALIENYVYFQDSRGDVWRVWMSFSDGHPLIEKVASNAPLPVAPNAVKEQG